MAIKVRNLVTHELGDELSEYFNLPEKVQLPPDPHEELKETIYTLDIDTEIKAEIVNKINKLKTTISKQERKTILKEIESFRKEYDI